MATKPRVAPLTRRWMRQRRHQRFISRVRLLVEWEEDSLSHRADAVTVDVSESGCMVVASAGLPLHEFVRLINPETGRRAEALVAWRSHEAWHFGLQLLEPDLSFWGLQFWTPVSPGTHSLYSKGWGGR
jgi:hypothetical protein